MSTAKSHSPPSSRILCHELVGDVVDAALSAGDGGRLEPVVDHLAVLAVVVAVEVHERRRHGSPCRSSAPAGPSGRASRTACSASAGRLARSRRCPCGGSAPRAGRSRRSRRAAPAGCWRISATRACHASMSAHSAGSRNGAPGSSVGMVGISNMRHGVMGPIRQRAGGGRGIRRASFGAGRATTPSAARSATS